MWMLVLRWQLNILNKKTRKMIKQEIVYMKKKCLWLFKHWRYYIRQNLTHGKRKICYFFIECWRRRTDWMINILARVALYQEKFVSIYFTFSLFFIFLCDERRKKHFRSSLELEFSSSSSSSVLIPFVWYAPTHQSALMRWHMCDFYEIMRKCHLLRKHSRFIQSLQFIEGTQFFY